MTRDEKLATGRLMGWKGYHGANSIMAGANLVREVVKHWLDVSKLPSMGRHRSLTQ